MELAEGLEPIASSVIVGTRHAGLSAAEGSSIELLQRQTERTIVARQGLI